MSKKILIIEDNDDIRENVVKILELSGYKVFAAGDGKTGVDLALKNLPDIILCDIMMPGLDGYGVLYLLHKNPQLEAIPFIFMTAKADRSDQRKGMELGADDYLTKPFDDVELLRAIDTRLKKQENREKFHSRTLDNLNALISKNSGLEALRKAVEERKPRPFKKNQVVYYEGDQPGGLYIVIKGKVKAVKLGADGRELMTGVYLNDHYLGTQAILAGQPYSDTATALEDSTLCLLPKELIDELLNRYPDVAREFIRLLANDIREKEEWLLQLAYHSVRKRMAEALVKLSHRNVLTSDGFKISREDLAAMAGVATETVSRTLSDFKEEGLIDKAGASIKVLNLAKLEKMKN